jgi:hypothetical protein
MMITSGVRQPGAWLVRRFPSAAAMQIPSRLRELVNAFAWKHNEDFCKNACCNAAMQIDTD